MGLRATKAQLKAYQLNLDGHADEVRSRQTRGNEEAQHQAILFAWIRSLQPKYPQLHFIFSTLNGIYIPPALLAKAVEGGLCRGVLDIWCMLPFEEEGQRCAGCVLELKKLRDGYPSKEQKKWAAQLVRCGLRVYFPRGAVEAWRCIACYAGITGADHWAQPLQAQEDLIRRMAA